MSLAAIIFAGLWLIICLASIGLVLWLERRDARRPPIEEHQENYWS